MEIEHKIKLPFGYKDKDGVAHKEVTFGKRLTAGDMMLLDADPRGQNTTQYWDLIYARSITSIGSKKAPIGIDVLLGLNSIDRADIKKGFQTFCDLNRDGRAYDFLDNHTVKTYFGFQIDGIEYRVVEIGNLLTGRDEVEADAMSEAGVIRECFLLGRRISKISTEDGSMSLDGPIDLEKFREIDAVDLNLLRTGANIAEAFFRLEGDEVSEERNGEGGSDPGEGNGNVGSGNTEPADKSNTELSEGSEGNE